MEEELANRLDWSVFLFTATSGCPVVRQVKVWVNESLGSKGGQEWLWWGEISSSVD